MDQFSKFSNNLESPSKHAAAVTPSNSTDLEYASRALYVGSSGNVQITTVGGETVMLANINAGSLVPIRVSRVWSTGTTATNILALW